VYNTNLMTSVMRPDPRYELALASQVPHTQTEHPDTSAVAVTLVESCENHAEIYLFADDAKLSKHITKESDKQILQKRYI